MNTTQDSGGSPHRLLVFIVAYQAESSLKEVLDRIPRSVLEDHEVEILVVDDASDDRTFSIGREYATAHPELPLVVLRNEYNQGYGGNQKIGYAYASAHGFDFVVLLHGDGQYAPEELGNLIQPLLDGTADAVFGSRMMIRGGALAGGMPLYKYVGNRILTGIQNFLLKRDLSEYHSGYRAYRIAALDEIHYKLNTNDFHFDTQIILQLMNNGSSRVNGIRYAWNVVVNTAASVIHGFGIFQQRRLDPVVATNSPYRAKLGFSSPHSFVLDAVPPGSRVIDLGASPVDVVNALTGNGCEVVVVDEDSAHDYDGTVEVIRQDLNEELAFDIGSFDTILMLDVVEHLKDPEDFFVRLRSQFGHEPKTLVLSTSNTAFITQRLYDQTPAPRRRIQDSGHTGRACTLPARCRRSPGRLAPSIQRGRHPDQQGALLVPGVRYSRVHPVGGVSGWRSKRCRRYVKTVTILTRDDAAVVAAFTLGLSMFVWSQLLSIALLVPVLALTAHAALGRESTGFDGVGPRSLLIRRFGQDRSCCVRDHVRHRSLVGPRCNSHLAHIDRCSDLPDGFRQSARRRNQSVRHDFSGRLPFSVGLVLWPGSVG